jgi:hypothetical protein
MRAYEFYIEDRGRPALEFRVVIARDDLRAREIAAGFLEESASHTGVEVRLSSRPIFALGSLDRRELQRSCDQIAT